MFGMVDWFGVASGVCKIQKVTCMDMDRCMVISHELLEGRSQISEYHTVHRTS